MIGRLLYSRRVLISQITICRLQSTNALSKSQTLDSDRIRLVSGWKAPKSGILLNIEVARECDRPILHKFLNEQTRLQEPIISSTSAKVNEISNVFEGILDRSVGSGLTLMMFKDETELIGIRMTSIAETPKEPIVGEFKLLPDYKELIDQQPGESRKDKQVAALCELMYGWGPSFLPPTCKQYFCLELIGILPQYRNDGLATKFCQELFKLAASNGLEFGEVLCTAKASQRVCQKLGLKVKMEVEYDKFLDGGQICFKNTNDGSTKAQLLIADLKEMGYF